VKARASGWLLLIAAMGMMCGLLAVDIASLMEFAEMRTPLFVGTMLGHLAATITAFVGGYLIPETRPGDARTRVTDVTGADR